ncbi:hypothetical protein [Legionella gresilensis]|uniref:hypothetical protein n=1 Tax=Legionella gresilensis TaxID=91823 RepID=UPI001040EA98|nr:hypothetical protein [Legionella gresilensis]
MVSKNLAISDALTIQYQNFIKDYKNFDQECYATLTTNISGATQELDKLDKVISLIENWRKRKYNPKENPKIKEKLKELMGYHELEKKLKKEEERVQDSEKERDREVARAPYGLTLEEMQLLLKVFGTSKDGKGVMYIESKEALLTEIGMKFPRYANPKDPKAVNLLNSLIKKIQESQEPWEEEKRVINSCVNKIDDFNENRQIYKKSQSRLEALTKDIEQLVEAKDKKVSLELFKEKRSTMKNYRKSNQDILDIFTKHRLPISTLTGNLETDLEAVQKGIKNAPNSKARKQYKVIEERLLQWIKNPTRLDESRKAINNALASVDQIVRFEKLKEELENQSLQGDPQISPISNGAHPHTFFSRSNGDNEELTNEEKVKKNKEKIKDLRKAVNCKGEGDLDTIVAEWKKLEEEIDALERKNEALMPNRELSANEIRNEVFIAVLKEGAILTIMEQSTSGDKNQAELIQYLETIKKEIEDLRSEKDDFANENTTAPEGMSF